MRFANASFIIRRIQYRKDIISFASGIHFLYCLEDGSRRQLILSFLMLPPMDRTDGEGKKKGGDSWGKGIHWIGKNYKRKEVLQMKKRNGYFVLVLLFLFILATSASSVRGQDQDKYGGNFIVGIYGEANYYMPPLTGDGFTYHSKYLLFDSIVRLDENLIPQPLLAKDWDISEDETTITFYLRDDVTWHDGEPFTARDVYFTYQIIANPLSFSAKTGYLDALVGFREFLAGVSELDKKLEAGDLTDSQWVQQVKEHHEDWKQLNAIEVLDDYTIRFNLAYPQGSFMTISTEVGIVPEHILKDVDPAEKDYSETAYASHPIATGPFKFVSWERGDHWILEANEDYFDGRPYLDRVIFRIIPDDTTRVAELARGNIHKAYTVPLAELDYLETTPGVKVLSGPSLGWNMINFQLERHFFDDLKVRQAIAHAFNKEATVMGLYEERYPVAHGPFNPAFEWAHNPDVTIYEYNPDRAVELLKEAGFEKRADGWYKEGKSLDFTLRVGTDSTAVEVTELFQADMNRIGINVTIEPLETAAWLDAIFSANFDMMHFGWTGLADPDGYIYTVHHSSGIGGRNVMKYRNNQVDELFDLARRTTDLDLRGEYYFEIQEILAYELPLIFLSYYVNYHAVSENIMGLVPNPTKHAAIFWSLNDAYWAND